MRCQPYRESCPEGAKASSDQTHWPKAIQHGAEVVTGARVQRIVVGSQGLVEGAEYIDDQGCLRFQAADVVILAANAIGSARLLQLSASSRFPDGLANSSGLVGRQLMMHPFATVAGIFEERFETWKGHVGSGIHCLQFYETDDSRGFLRGAKWSLAPSTGGPINAALPARAGDVVWGPDHHRQVAERLGHSLSWGMFGEDLPDDQNRVELDPDATDGDGLPIPKIHYRVGDNSRRLLAYHVERATESMIEAGAKRVDSLELMRDAGWHLLGTARMGDDPETSVVDRWGRSHDVANLYVVDGSVFVTSAASIRRTRSVRWPYGSLMG